MELEKAKKQCEVMRDNLYFNNNREAIDTVLRTLQRYENELDLDYVDKNYISKEQIRAKIEELNRDKGGFGLETIELRIGLASILGAIKVLQELLEEGEKLWEKI